LKRRQRKAESQKGEEETKEKGEDPEEEGSIQHEKKKGET